MGLPGNRRPPTHGVTDGDSMSSSVFLVLPNQSTEDDA